MRLLSFLTQVSHNYEDLNELNPSQRGTPSHSSRSVAKLFHSLLVVPCPLWRHGMGTHSALLSQMFIWTRQSQRLEQSLLDKFSLYKSLFIIIIITIIIIISSSSIIIIIINAVVIIIIIIIIINVVIIIIIINVVVVVIIIIIIIIAKVRTAVASFTKEINQRLAKRPFETNGRLANLVLCKRGHRVSLITWINFNSNFDK